jgi:hypothetical protein
MTLDQLLEQAYVGFRCKQSCVEQFVSPEFLDQEARDGIEGQLLGRLGLCARIAASGETVGCEESERSTLFVR